MSPNKSKSKNKAKQKETVLNTAIKAFKDKHPTKGKGLSMEAIVSKYGYKDELEATIAMIIAAQWLESSRSDSTSPSPIPEK